MAENEKSQDKQEKKIIVDEDWKQEAEKEKEILAKQQEAEKQKEAPKRGPLPKGNLAALISMLVTQAFFSLGLLKIEGQEDKEPDLVLAKYNIDMLETIEEKTKGNLTEEEQKVLTETLNQVRMAYVQASNEKK